MIYQGACRPLDPLLSSCVLYLLLRLYPGACRPLDPLLGYQGACRPLLRLYPGACRPLDPLLGYQGACRPLDPLLDAPRLLCDCSARRACSTPRRASSLPGGVPPPGPPARRAAPERRGALRLYQGACRPLDPLPCAPRRGVFFRSSSKLRCAHLD